MRWIRRLGLVLAVCGALLVVAGTVSVDSAIGERGVDIGVADDQNALLGIEYPAPDRTVDLESSDADSGGGCLFVWCSEYKYEDREVVTLVDNADGDLSVTDLSAAADNDAILTGEELRDEPVGGGLRIVRGDFSCPVDPPGGWGGIGDQTARSATVTVDVTVSDGDMSITLQREVDVQCVPD